VHPAAVYADLLKRKVLRHGVDCWLVNTGWVGGPYGIGKRISIAYTRALLNAALRGHLQGVPYVTDPVFGFQVPAAGDGVPPSVLDPASSWSSREAYMNKYRQLAARFVENFKKYAAGTPPEVQAAGPRL
jgi:phosphoenolpyruvate carboxykinase (ATP)